MNVYCPNCENACSVAAIACPKCGHPLQKVPVATEPETTGMDPDDLATGRPSQEVSVLTERQIMGEEIAKLGTPHARSKTKTKNEGRSPQSPLSIAFSALSEDF